MPRKKTFTEEEYKERRRESSRKWVHRNKDYMRINSAKWAKKNPSRAREIRMKTFNKHKNQPYFRLRRLWYLIVERCNNPQNKSFHRYGQRGISICSEWLNDREKFISWALRNGYEIGLTIERINNNGNYDPTNCRFATPKEQSNNTRRNVFVEYQGKRKTLSQWSEFLSIPRSTLWWRHKQGHSLEKMFTPLHLQSKKELIYLNNRL